MTPKRNGSSIGRPRKQEIREGSARLSYRNKNPEGRVVKQPSEKSTVSDLVYRYLRKVACITFKKKLQSAAYKKFRKRNVRRRTVQDPWPRNSTDEIPKTPEPDRKSKQSARFFTEHRNQKTNKKSFRDKSMYNP